MERRTLLRALGAIGLPAPLTACGGGGPAGGQGPAGAPKIESLTADQPGYFVGDTAKLTARFSGGSARLEPGAIAVASGVERTVGPLSANTTYTLVVGAGQAEVRQEISLAVSYRNTFSTLDMGFARTLHLALPLADGRVALIGGQGKGGMPPTSVMAFNLQGRSFAAIGELLTGRLSHSATLLADGSVLVVGGSRSVLGAPIAERFDPKTGMSRATAGQPVDNRSQHTATLLPDGKVLVAGGLTNGGNANSDTADLYDPATDQFVRLPARLAFKRYAHVALRITDNLVMLYGGAAIGAATAPPELFDIAARSSQALAPRPADPATRTSAAAVRLAGSDWLVTGGETVSEWTALASVAAIAVGGIAINSVAPMASGRSSHSAAALTDGRALITGGMGPTEARLSSTELYALAPAALRAGPAMAYARSGHSATALPNGMVLVAGGFGIDSLALSSAELYS
jgi:hypothetical protein